MYLYEDSPTKTSILEWQYQFDAKLGGVLILYIDTEFSTYTLVQHCSEPCGCYFQIVYNATDKLRTIAFITSLYPSLHSNLSERYVRNPPAMDDVGFIQVTHGHLQHFNEEEDKQALAEMISLSFSDYLFVTPLSTFGGTAQGYGALTPWFIDNRPDSPEACVRAQTVDTCYQIPEFKFSCPYEPKLDDEWVLATVPYLKDCLQVDAKYGIQLITTQR